MENVWGSFMFIFILSSAMSFLHLLMLNILSAINNIDDNCIERFWNRYPNWIRNGILGLSFTGSDLISKYFITKKRSTIYYNYIGFLIATIIYYMASYQSARYSDDMGRSYLILFFTLIFPIAIVLNIYQSFKITR